MKDIYISKNHNDDPEEIDVFSDSSQASEHEEQRTPRRKKHRLRKLLCIIIVILLIPSLPIMGASAISGYTRNDLKRNEYVSLTDVTRNPLVANILLLGVDGEKGQSSRSDSMILVSIDFVHRKIKLTSFLRDCWVEIPSKDKKAKLNASYAYGGAQLVKDTIEYNYGVGIDHYIKVDFNMFKTIIDRLGGVEVEVTEKESDFINRTTRQRVESGKSVHLNGEEALVYCRIRKLDTDYMRTFRQRKVITALLDKAKKSSITDLITMAREVFPLIETDLSPSEIAVLAYKGMAALLGFELVQIRVPTDEQMRTETVGGQWVEIADMNAVREYMHDFIYTGKNMTE